MSGTEEWMTKKRKEKWSIHTVVYPYNGYYSVFKRKEILEHATTWMNLEDIILTETHSHKNRQTLGLGCSSQVGHLRGMHTRPWGPPSESEVPTIVKCVETEISTVVSRS